MAITTQNLLEHMAIPGMPGMYLLGCLERRVTIYSQQLRALNLVHALFDRGQAAKHMRVAVIGGGIAGLTCAVAAARKGCRVTVLEKESRLLHLLEGSTSRWVHPRIFDWPQSDAKRQDTDLPFLTWSADTAGRVARKLLQEWQVHTTQYLHDISVSLECQDLRYFPAHQESKNWYLTWNSRGRKSGAFDIVIWAIGFGIERTVAPLPLRSYWRDDDLHQSRLDSIGRTTFLVSGCGDGGLTDLFRLRLTQFDHFEVLRDLITKAEIDNAHSQLLIIEAAARKEENPFTQAEILENGYHSLQIRETQRWLKALLRPDVMVTLNSQSPIPFSLGSSVLNRFLLTCLLRVDAISYWVGEIKEIAPQESGKLRVTLSETPQKIQKPKLFDRIIIRHGAESPLTEWPELWARSQALLQRNVLDQTREPLWDWDFWNAPAKTLTVPLRLTETPEAQVRALMGMLMPDEAEFSAFLIDYYPYVQYQRGGTGVTRTALSTLLLATTPIEDIIDKLSDRFREKAQLPPPQPVISDFLEQDLDADKLGLILLSILKDWDDLLAFFCDYFPDFYRRIGSSMDREPIIQLALKSCDHQQLYGTIKFIFPHELALHREPMHVTVPTPGSLRRFLQTAMPPGQGHGDATGWDSLLTDRDYTQILVAFRETFPNEFERHKEVLIPAEEPSRSAMRDMLLRACPILPDLNVFCQKYFEHVRMRFTDRMEYQSRVSELMMHARTSMILIRLREEFPERNFEPEPRPD